MSKPLANQLTGLPTTNGNELVKSFVKSQQRNAPIYAAEGKAVQASWNNLIVAPPTTPRNPELTMNSNQDVSGFQTPVLKPRVLREESIRVDGKIERSSECAIKVSATRQRAKFPKPPRNLKSNNFSDRTCRTSKAGEKQPETTFEKHARKDKQSRPRDPQGRSQEGPPVDGPCSLNTRKKRRGCEYSDSEREDRLADRRARKRIKRNIIKADENTVEKTASTKTKDKKHKKPDKKQTKLPAGLAILHGFSTTNIGQKRITLQPGALGMFGKGKASMNTKVNKNTTKNGAASSLRVFSEARFLNPSVPQTINSDSESFVSVTPSVLPVPKASSQAQKAASESTPSEDGVGGIAVALQGNATKERHEGRSEVWDIENDDIILPSGSDSLVATSADTSNMVWNVGDRSWAVQEAVLKPSITPEQSNMDEVIEEGHSSLHPSNSASQAPQRRLSPKLLDLELKNSRFFPLPNHLQATHLPRPAQPEEEFVKDRASIEQKTTDGMERYASESPASPSPQSPAPETRGPVLDQNHQSLCGSVDSLEEALKLCEADDHLLETGSSHCLDFGHVSFGLEYSHQHSQYIEDVPESFQEVGPCYEDDFFFQLDSEPTNTSYLEQDDPMLDDAELEYAEPGSFMEIDCADDNLDEMNSDPDPDEEEGWQQSTFQEADDYSSQASSLYYMGDDDEDLLPASLDDTSDFSIDGADYTFNQGRALLLGLTVHNSQTQQSEKLAQVTTAEQEVAKNIKGHWFPQRP